MPVIRDETIHVQVQPPDERTFLFPNNRVVTSLLLQADTKEETVLLSALFKREGQTAAQDLCRITNGQTQSLLRGLVEAYYQGRSQNLFLSHAVKVNIGFQANGFHVTLEDNGNSNDLFMSPTSLLKLAQGLVEVLDSIAAKQREN